jgi:hypothetical protein
VSQNAGETRGRWVDIVVYGMKGFLSGWSPKRSQADLIGYLAKIWQRCTPLSPTPSVRSLQSNLHLKTCALNAVPNVRGLQRLALVVAGVDARRSGSQHQCPASTAIDCSADTHTRDASQYSRSMFFMSGTVQGLEMLSAARSLRRRKKKNSRNDCVLAHGQASEYRLSIPHILTIS